MSVSGANYDRVKRLLDIVIGTTALIVTAPIQAVISLFLLRALGKPIFFRQDRPGKDGAIFQLVKFRTMIEPDETHTTDAERLTPLGSFLRKTSLDELPTFWNVLKGDMSLVGPRPLLVSYLDLYTNEQARRHEVRPGVTGLAQVSGRNSVSWEDRFAYDVEYVDNRSFCLDLTILIRTLKLVIFREGISQEGHVTMTPFVGK